MLFTALSLLSFFSSDAHALSCMEGAYDSNIEEGAVNIPLNVKPHVWYVWSGFESEPVELRKVETGESVDGEYVELNINGVLKIDPVEDLEPNTEYEIYNPAIEYPVTTFTTGEEADTTSPEAPEILNVAKNYGSDEWGSWKWLNITIAGAESNAIYKVEISKTEDFASSEYTYVTSWDEVLSIGHGVCNSNIDMATDDAKWSKVATIDAGGNESETLESFARGCQSASTPINFLISLLESQVQLHRYR